MPSRDPSNQHIERLEGAVAQQEAVVRRMITQGAPTQAAEDRLRQLQRELSRRKARSHANRSAGSA